MEKYAQKTIQIALVGVIIVLAILLGNSIKKAASAKVEVKAVQSLPHQSTKGLKYGAITIIVVDGCEYVLWYQVAGSDMEHHAACNNPIHKTQ